MKLYTTPEDIQYHLISCYGMRKRIEVMLNTPSGVAARISGWIHQRDGELTWDALLTKNQSEYQGNARISFKTEHVTRIESNEHLSIIYVA